MNEQKLYAVKNDEGKYWDFEDRDGFRELRRVHCPATSEEEYATDVILDYGGHVVTLIEEPEKVVITKEQSEIVEKARVSDFPGSYIYSRLLMEALINGYTVANEKKYNVKVPLVQAQGGLWFYINSDDKLDAIYIKELAKKFTMNEIEENGLQDCEKEEVTDDDD